MWELPDCGILDPEDRSTIGGNQRAYRTTKEAYKIFATDFASRLVLL